MTRHHPSLLTFALTLVITLWSSLCAAQSSPDAGARSAPNPDADIDEETLPDPFGRAALVPNSPSAPETPRSVAAPRAPEAPAAPQPATPPQAPRAPSSETVFRAVDGLRGLSTWTVIPFAHFRRGARHVVIAWPAINSRGRVVDATVVGICLEVDERGQLAERGRRWVVRDPGAARIALGRALGGDDYEVVMGNQGAPIAELGPALARLGSTFAEAVARGDRAAARESATAFTRLLALDRVAFGNDVAQLLWMAARHRGSLRHVRTTRGAGTATLELEVLRGRRRMRTIRARARPTAANPQRWIVHDYQ